MSVAASAASASGAAPAAGASSQPRSRNSLVAHWRGELPLPLSFWLNWAALTTLIGTALGLETIRVDVLGQDLRWGGLAVLIGWPAMLVVAIWGAVGAWRSASARRALAAAPLWPWAAQAGTGLGMAFIVASTVANFLPEAAGYAQLARGTDPLGQSTVTLSRDGRRLHLEGYVGRGDADRVEALLRNAPEVTLVEIASPGGRLAEATRIAQGLRARPRHIRVTGACDNACAVILMAGQRRQWAPGAQIGFHRVPLASFNPAIKLLADRQQHDAYVQAGLPEAVVARMAKTSATSAWHPDASDLVAHGLLTVPDRPFDIDLPAARDAAVPDYIDALHANPAWDAIERRFPGSVTRASEQMQAARAQGADDPATQIEGQRSIEPLMQTLLLGASPELRIRFIELLAQQLEAAHPPGTENCRELLAGDTTARASLPAALAWRESAWLIDALAEPPRTTVRRRPTALESEVLRRSLGDQAPTLLARLRQPPRAGPRDSGCNRSAALIAAVLELPVAERRLAARWAFEGETLRQAHRSE
ncbi:hypothetical protein BH11PSE8_BH11PSE8_07650 [soil metagenome]